MCNLSFLSLIAIPSLKFWPYYNTDKKVAMSPIKNFHFCHKSRLSFNPGFHLIQVLFPNLHLCVDRDVLWQDGAGGGFIIVS
jgi:hypothetical protein